jgi:preprotein translocase subunit YajC
MSRLVVSIIVLVVIIGGLYFLSTLPKEQPTHQIEVPVTQGNAH